MVFKGKSKNARFAERGITDGTVKLSFIQFHEHAIMVAANIYSLVQRKYTYHEIESSCCQ